jgi:2-polyprenyl-3-methyl-5-hydroxy-6-metoxy-1,4-benzoquinol methylase
VTLTKPYPLDNASSYSEMHHTALTALLDPVSTQRTLDLFGGDLSGRRCLEVGAGGGGYAVWLADQVGETGHVTALDLKPELIPTHPNISIVQHDLMAAAPPGGPYDLIHARLTLGHLPRREEILHDLVSALAPGGTILIEDWDASRVAEMVMSAPDEEAARLYTRYQETVGLKVFGRAGTDRTWARRIHDRMVKEGLVDIDTTINARTWAGGSTGSRLVVSTIGQTYPVLLEAGLTEDELNQLRVLLDDPRLVLAGFLLYSTSGKKP